MKREECLSCGHHPVDVISSTFNPDETGVDRWVITGEIIIAGESYKFRYIGTRKGPVGKNHPWRSRLCFKCPSCSFEWDQVSKKWQQEDPFAVCRLRRKHE